MSQRRYSQITKAVYERPWAIQPAMLAVIEEVVRLRAIGAPLTDDEIEARVSAAQNGPRLGPSQAQGVAVIPIYGVISHRMNLLSAMSGGTSVEGLTGAFRSAMADPEIGAVVFDVDSPGGSVDGIFELADEIFAARGQKPMAAVANSLMASAAFLLGSQTDEVVASPSSVVGSIGVFGWHVDESAADEMAGEKWTLISAGEGKAAGNQHQPLPDDVRAALTERAEDYYALFVNAVTRARGVKASVVTGDWKAREFTAKRGKTAGLVDRVETLDATVRRMIVKANQANPSALAAVGAADPPQAIAALMATLPIHEQLALVNAEGDRIAAHYAKRAELRAKEGRVALTDETEAQLAALASLRTTQGDPDDTDLDTDQPEEADPPQAAKAIAHPLEILEAATRGGYSLPVREVPIS